MTDALVILREELEVKTIEVSDETYEALEKRRAIYDVPTFDEVIAIMLVKQYQVPLLIHMEWCKWCAENVSDEELKSN